MGETGCDIWGKGVSRAFWSTRAASCILEGFSPLARSSASALDADSRSERLSVCNAAIAHEVSLAKTD